MDFGRLVTAMVTPFNAEGAVDWDATGRLIDYLIEEQQSDSLVVSGMTGESPTLNDEEKTALFKFTVERANGRCKIIAGTGSNDTAHSVHLLFLRSNAVSTLFCLSCRMTTNRVKKACTNILKRLPDRQSFLSCCITCLAEPL